MTKLPKAMTSQQRHPKEDRGAELYETPEVATLALLKAERIPHVVWEPAAGKGAIVRVLRAAGHEVLSTDVHDYGSPDVDLTDVNFMAQVEAPPIGIEAIITNPPFSLGNEFVQRALLLCPRVYMLLRLGFLESEKRSAILDCGELARVLVFKNRLPMMHRDGWDGPKSTSTQAYGWFIFDRYHRGYPQLIRIAWEKI